MEQTSYKETMEFVVNSKEYRAEATLLMDSFKYKIDVEELVPYEKNKPISNDYGQNHTILDLEDYESLGLEGSVREFYFKLFQ